VVVAQTCYWAVTRWQDAFCSAPMTHRLARPKNVMLRPVDRVCLRCRLDSWELHAMACYHHHPYVWEERWVHHLGLLYYSERASQHLETPWTNVLPNWAHERDRVPRFLRAKRKLVTKARSVGNGRWLQRRPGECVAPSKVEQTWALGVGARPTEVVVEGWTGHLVCQRRRRLYAAVFVVCARVSGIDGKRIVQAGTGMAVLRHRMLRWNGAHIDRRRLLAAAAAKRQTDWRKEEEVVASDAVVDHQRRSDRRAIVVHCLDPCTHHAHDC
jgi:hypothetical protein